MKSIVFVAVAAVALISSAAQAEIICTERGGCWETGKQIRLPSSPYRGVDTTVTSRENSNVRQDPRTVASGAAIVQRSRHSRMPRVGRLSHPFGA